MENTYKIGLEFKADKPKTKNSILTITGYASTNDVDSYNEIVEPTAFTDTMDFFMEHPILLFGHDWFAKPIGKVTSWHIDAKGLWIEADIADTAEGRDIKALVEFGILKAFSIGFQTLLREDGMEEGDPSTIKKLKLFEISVVNVPANRAALIEEAKKLNVELKSLTISDGGERTERKGKSMGIDAKTLEAIKKAEELVGPLETSLETVNNEVANLQSNLEKQAKLLKQVEEKAENLHKGLITQEEFKTFTAKIGEDILTLTAQIEKAKIAQVEKAKQRPFIDWRFALADLETLRDDNGMPLSEMDKKAYKYMQVPIDYKSHPDAQVIKTLRQLNDIIVCLDAVSRSGKARFNTINTKAYQLYREIMAGIDPEFSKAMSSESGYGSEWIPTGFSSELYDLYRLGAVLESKIPSFDMPSPSYPWPYLSSVAKGYIATEATTANPDTLRKSNLGTGKVTFTAGTFAAAVPWSQEIGEDSIINMFGEISKEVVTALSDGYESMLINGDSTSTHMDNTTTTLYQTYDMETYEKGFRRIASDLSKTFDTQSATTGVGDATAAFAAADLRYMRKLMGKMGVKTDQVKFVTGVNAYFQILSMAQFSQPGTYDAGATWRIGALNSIDGCELLVSAQVPENLNASGVYDGSTVDNTCAFAFNAAGFKIGNRRSMTLEYEKNILTQQWSFVGSMRKSFQRMAVATGLYPVALGYNINN